jgi:hypothetical protein
MMRRIRLSLLILLTAFAGLGPALAGPLPIGSILGSKNATLDGQQAIAHTTVLSGDSLQVRDGLALVTLDQGNRMIMGRDTAASFLREADAVSVSLTRGNLSLYHPEASSGFRVKVGDVTVAPAKGYKTLGEIAMVDGLLLVTAKDGVLQVEEAGTTQEVSKGKTITLATAAASAPAPTPPGNRHIKHILRVSPAALLYLGIAAGAGGVAWAIVESTSSGKPASPITPTP